MPVATPVTVPDPVPTVAIPVFRLLHTPPPLTSDKLILKPGHTGMLPVIFAGNGFTVTIAEFVLAQPVGNVYVIIAVPVASPLTIPDPEPTDAVPGALLVQ